ncbi:MAG: repair protein RecN [Actinomycetota bacterium]|jgi:DNA repair protein RecN (Recombination protein N)|nr:repair protein RecN [Actinomycetota bacterium]
MLQELVVEGLGVIERAELVLEGGSTALTGETGAGKTLLVAAVGLLMGGPGDTSMIREGVEGARVEGSFTLPPGHPAMEILVERGFIDEEETEGPTEVVLSRTLSLSGSGRVRVNGRMASIPVLAEITSDLIEMAGQHEHGRIGTPASQRKLLDAFAGEDARRTASEVKQAVRAANAAHKTVETLTATEADRDREIARLEEEIAEIERAGLQPGETERLTAEAQRLENAESIAEGLNEATDALTADDGAVDLVKKAEAAVRGIVEGDESLAAQLTRLESAGHELTDVALELSNRLVTPDSETLADVRDRLGAIGRLRRKYGDDETQILAHLERSKEQFSELTEATSTVEEAEQEREAQSEAAREGSTKLSDLRKKAAAKMESEITKLFKELALEGTKFSVALTPVEVGEGGAETVDFQIAAPGESAKPIGKVASGGELSRIALALHLVTSSAEAQTLIFDEVDSGVGGEAARAVGQSLAQLARSSGAQVLVVTHLPQVAAFATSHFRIVKETTGNRTRAKVAVVEGEERVEELSRMLSGLPESERAREHAQELLDLAASSSF